MAPGERERVSKIKELYDELANRGGTEKEGNITTFLTKKNLN